MAIVLHLFQNGIVTGLWCPKCLRPSGIDVQLGTLSDHGVTPDSIHIRKCHDCGAPLPRESTSS